MLIGLADDVTEGRNAVVAYDAGDSVFIGAPFGNLDEFHNNIY
jgi:hypothetical protein